MMCPGKSGGYIPLKVIVVLLYKAVTFFGFVLSYFIIRKLDSRRK